MSVETKEDIFSESFSRAIIEVKPQNQEAFEAFAKEYLPYELIGVVGGEKFKINDVSMDLEELKKVYFGRFQEVVEQDL